VVFVPGEAIAAADQAANHAFDPRPLLNGLGKVSCALMSETPEMQDSYGQKTVTGALYMTALRWTIRAIGLVSVSITARILTPEDFGIHSSAAIAMSFFLLLPTIGVGEFLTKEKHLTPETVDTSWTIQILVAALVMLLVLIFAPFAPAVLQDARVTPVLLLLAAVPLIDALNHPRLLLLLREFDYATLFKVRCVEKLISFFTTITLITIFQTYWAIALGALVSAFLFTAYTHILWTARPRLSLKQGKNIGTFATLSVVRAIASFTATIADSLVARQFVTSAQFGGYHNTKDLARNLVEETAAPFSAALLPTLSRLVDDRVRFGRAVTNSYAATLYIISYCAVGAYVLADPVIRLILGTKWVFAIPYFQAAVLIIVPNVLELFLQRVMISMNNHKQLTIIMVIKAVAAVAAALTLQRYGQPIYLLYGAAGAWALTHVILIAVISHQLSAYRQVLVLYIKPSIVAGAMAAFFTGTHDMITQWGWPFVLQMLLEGALLTAVFVSTVSALWTLTGRKEGPETACWGLLRERFGQVFKLRDTV